MRVFSALLVVLAVGQSSQAQQPPQSPWAIGPQSLGEVSLPADVRRTVADLDYDETEPITGVAADLNGDGVADYLLQSAQRLCGNGGCRYVLIDGVTRRTMGSFFGSLLVVRAETVHDHPNIATYTHQSAESATYTEYGFNGTVYVVTSSRTVEGAAVSRLLDELRIVPVWRPRP